MVNKLNGIYLIILWVLYHLQATYTVTIKFNNFVGYRFYLLTYPPKFTIRPAS